ncbi:hypothetical protein N0V85_009412, partial [Neurospora sp. IMI 360204]
RMARPLVATGFLDQVQTSPDGSSGDSGYKYKHTKFSLAYTIPYNPNQQQETKPGHLFTALYNQYLKLMVEFADSYLPFVAALARNQNQNQPSSAHSFSHSSSFSSSSNPSSSSTSSFSFSSSSFPPGSSGCLARGAREPQDPFHNSFTFAYGQYGRATAREVMEQDPERLETFQRGMKGLDVMVPCVGHFDFGVLAASEEEEEEMVELVDVGGGHGAVLKQILDAHPQLNPERIVLQDFREDVVELARAGQRNGTGLPRGVRVMVHNIIGQPVRGAKAYFMRLTLRHLCDDVATQILSRLAEAMSHDSRVLVCELALPQRVTVLDQCVMSIGGKERTEEGFRKIFEGAGLELVKVWRVPGVTGACVEGRLKSGRGGRQH